MGIKDKIVITILALIMFSAHAFYPVSSMLGYKLPIGAGLVGILGTLGVILLGGIYSIWRK